MRLKKMFTKCIIVGGIFILSSVSFGAIISLQDNDLNNFWITHKLDTSFIDISYAESGGGESGGYKRQNARSVNIKEKNNINDINKYYDNQLKKGSLNKIDIKKEIVNVKKKKILSEEEKMNIQDRFQKVSLIISKKYKTDTAKLNIYRRLNTLLLNKIKILEGIKLSINNEKILDKYEKKVLLFRGLNDLIQDKILVYIDSIENTVFSEKGGMNNDSLSKNNIPIKKVSIKKVSPKKDAISADRNKQIELQKIQAEKNRIERIRKEKIAQGKILQAKRLATEKEAARLAKIESDRQKSIAKEKARIAAQERAKQKAKTRTRAS